MVTSGSCELTINQYHQNVNEMAILIQIYICNLNPLFKDCVKFLQDSQKKLDLLTTSGFFFFTYFQIQCTPHVLNSDKLILLLY